MLVILSPAFSQPMHENLASLLEWEGKNVCDPLEFFRMASMRQTALVGSVCHSTTPHTGRFKQQKFIFSPFGRLEHQRAKLLLIWVPVRLLTLACK